MHLKLHFNSTENSRGNSSTTKINVTKIEFETESNQSKNVILDYQVNIINPAKDVNVDNFDIQFNESYNKFTLNYNNINTKNSNKPSLNNPKYHKEYGLEMDSDSYAIMQKVSNAICNQNLKQIDLVRNVKEINVKQNTNHWQSLTNYVANLKNILIKKTVQIQEQQEECNNEKFIYHGENVLEKLDYYNGYRANSNQQSNPHNSSSKYNKINIVEMQKNKLETANKNKLDNDTSDLTINIEIKLLINQKYIDKIDNIKIFCNQSIQLDLESLPRFNNKSASYMINYNSYQESRINLAKNHQIKKLHINITSNGNLCVSHICVDNELNINNTMHGKFIGLAFIQCKKINITNCHKGDIILNDINQKVDKLNPPPTAYLEKINIKNLNSGNIYINNMNAISANIDNVSFGEIEMNNIKIINCNMKNYSVGNISVLNRKLNYNHITNMNLSNLSKGNIVIQSTDIVNAKINLIGFGNLSLKSGTIKNLITNTNDKKLIIEPSFKIYNYG